MMKKAVRGFVLTVVGFMMLPSVASADDMEVTLIGGQEEEAVPVSLDDIQLNKEATIDGYAIILPTEFQMADQLGYYQAGANGIYYSYDYHYGYYQSGQEAEYALLRMDITNLATISRDFLADCEVKAVYDDTYEYAGWTYQCNYDNATDDSANRYGEDNGIQNVRWAIDSEDNFPIEPMYQGHYIFGCTLPNSIVNSKSPLRMEIKIGGNDITYHIRK